MFVVLYHKPFSEIKAAGFKMSGKMSSTRRLWLIQRFQGSVVCWGTAWINCILCVSPCAKYQYFHVLMKISVAQLKALVGVLFGHTYCLRFSGSTKYFIHQIVPICLSDQSFVSMRCIKYFIFPGACGTFWWFVSKAESSVLSLKPYLMDGVMPSTSPTSE